MTDKTKPKSLHEIHVERENQYLSKSISDKRIKLDRLREERRLNSYLKSMELGQ